MTQNKILVGLAGLLLLGVMSVFSVSQTEKAISFVWVKLLKTIMSLDCISKFPLLITLKSLMHVFKQWMPNPSGF